MPPHSDQAARRRRRADRRDPAPGPCRGPLRTRNWGFRDGIQVIGGRTLITEEKQAELSLTDGDLRFELNAGLNPVQGEGHDDQLSLNVNVTHGDDQPQIPSMTVPWQLGPASRSARSSPLTPGSMVTSSHWSRSPPAPDRSSACSANNLKFRMSAKGG